MFTLFLKESSSGRKGPEYELVESQDEADVLDISSEDKAKLDIGQISADVTDKVSSVGSSVSTGVNVSLATKTLKKK